VIVPDLGADVWLDGQKQPGGGKRRTYVLSSREEDGAYSYHIVVAWGAGHRVERQGELPGGVTAVIDFTQPRPTTVVRATW
jgi:hypothetical protein